LKDGEEEGGARDMLLGCGEKEGIGGTDDGGANGLLEPKPVG